MEGRTVYLASPGLTGTQGSDSPPSVIAFDLDSGHQLWSHPFPGVSDLVPLTANPQGVQVAAIYSTSVTADLTSLSQSADSSGAGAALDSGEEAAFNNLTMNVETPYAVMAGSRLAIAFPAASNSGATLLGVLAPP